MARRGRGRRSRRPPADADAPSSASRPGDGPAAGDRTSPSSDADPGARPPADAADRTSAGSRPGGRQASSGASGGRSAGSGASGQRSSRRRRRGPRPGRTTKPPPAEREFSCGGVVVHEGACLVINPVRPDGRTIATLPKGHPEDGEDPPTAALREIWEETAVSARVAARLGEVVYWYQREGKRIRKTVRMYLCDYVEGDPVADGFEVTRAYWMPLEQALSELAFPGDREMVAQAIARAAR